MPDAPPAFRPFGWKKVERTKEAPGAANERQKRRLYRTGSTKWRRLRRRVLDTEPLCRLCARAGRITAANEVDHIDGDAYNNATDNLQPLCKPCHSAKTAREMNGR